MENKLSEIKNTNQRARPELLTVLCVLTFIGSGSSALANGFFFLTIEPVKALIAEQGTFSFMGTDLNLDFILDINPMFFLLQSITLIVSFIGALQMWNLRKVGFHLYTIAQILLLIFPKVFVPSLPFPFFEMMVTSVFVYLYYKNTAFMT